MPAISVIMPVYNSENYLKEAIDSILAQTFTDFEFLIFNDGSTDHSKEIVSSFKDKRIRFFDDDKNRGYTIRLNDGLIASTGRYIARMDSDDISVKDRFQKQFNFLEANPEIAVCGGRFEFFGNTSQNSFNWVNHYDPEMIKINLLFDCAICHPTVMIRNKVLTDHLIRYKVKFEPSEDYELWTRISRDHQIANLNETILFYRVSEDQISNKKNERQRNNKFLILEKQLQELGIQATSLNLRIHDHLFFGEPILSYDFLPKISAWIKLLVKQNSIYKIYDPPKFRNYLQDLFNKNLINYHQQLKSTGLIFKCSLFIKKALRWNSIK